jgi:hypothetical protein
MNYEKDQPAWTPLFSEMHVDSPYSDSMKPFPRSSARRQHFIAVAIRFSLRRRIHRNSSHVKAAIMTMNDAAAMPNARMKLCDCGSGSGASSARKARRGGWGSDDMVGDSLGRGTEGWRWGIWRRWWR